MSPAPGRPDSIRVPKQSETKARVFEPAEGPRPVSAAPAPDAGLRAIEDAMLAIANLPLTKERGDDLLRVIRPALAAAPVTDAGLRTYAFRLVEAIDAKDEANIHGWTEALRAALSRQAEKETA